LRKVYGKLGVSRNRLAGALAALPAPAEVLEVASSGS
jgi:hypothetical protein